MKDRKQKINKDYPWVASFFPLFFVLSLFYSSIVIYNVVLMSAE